MITWNCRVFQETNGDYVIREVFYADDGSIAGCTENPVEPWGESLEALARDIDWFKEALQLPVLKLANIPVSQVKPQQQRRERRDNISHEQLMAELGLSHSSVGS